MTDLDAHVNASGRSDRVKQVREKINQLGIQYLYCQFVSVTGRIVGKGIPADHWERVAERGFQLVLWFDRKSLRRSPQELHIGYGAEASELVGIHDPETFMQLPWDKPRWREFTAPVFATARRRRIPAGI